MLPLVAVSCWFGRQELRLHCILTVMYTWLTTDSCYIPFRLQAQGKDGRTLRSLYYLAGVYVSCGSAGTPTLYDPTLCKQQAGWLMLWHVAWLAGVLQ